MKGLNIIILSKQVADDLEVIHKLVYLTLLKKTIYNENSGKLQ